MSYTPGAQDISVTNFAYKFPASASLADATTNPSTTTIGSALMGYDGFTWNRIRVGLTGSTSSSLGMINSAITMATGSLSTLPIGKFNGTKPSLLDTQFAEAQTTARGVVLVANDELPQAQDDTNRVLWVSPRPLADVTAGNILTWVNTLNGNGAVAKASPGRLYHFFGYCVTQRYIQVHNATSAPADGATPLFSILVPANSPFSFDWPDFGYNCSIGIYVCASSAHLTKVLSTTSDTDLHTAVG